MRGLVIAGAGLCLVASGCAKPPEAISASYISDVPYRSWSCQNLGDETIRLNQALATTSKQQSDARTGDAMGVLFLGMPVSTLSGSNVASEVARLKGEIDAVNRAMMINGCSRATPAAMPSQAPITQPAARPAVIKPVGRQS